jgi:protein TonB
VEGLVLVRAAVDASGYPADVAIVRSSGSEMLDRAALDAVGGWRFSPARRDGTAVAAEITIPIRFKLDGIAIADAR